MGLFGKWHQAERAPEETKEQRQESGPETGEQTIDVERAMAVIGARQAFLQALSWHLVSELPPKKRDYLLEELQETIRGWIMLPPPPVYVSSRVEQDFRDELRRAMEVLIERSTKPRSTSR